MWEEKQRQRDTISPRSQALGLHVLPSLYNSLLSVLLRECAGLCQQGAWLQILLSPQQVPSCSTRDRKGICR